MLRFLRPFTFNRCLNKLTNYPLPLVSPSSSVAFSSQKVQLDEDVERLVLSGDEEQGLVDPLDVPDFFNVHRLVSLRQLFNNRVHFGHKEGTLNEYMTPYIYGSRLGVCIIDLNQTVARLREALNVTAHVAFRGGVILFLSNHKETGQYVEKTAMECGEYAHCRPYSTYSFTSSKSFYGKHMRLPDLCIFLSTFNNVFLDHVAIRDCARLMIPTIAICDTNADPRLVTYPVPGNDDTSCAIHLYCDLFKQTILKAKAKREEILEIIKKSSSNQDRLLVDTDA